MESGEPKGRGWARDRRGEGGFFEELPAFFLVVVGLAAFLLSAASSWAGLAREREAGTLQEDCRNLARSFRAWDGVLARGLLTREPLPGRLDSQRLDGLTTAGFLEELAPGHPFNLTVRDLRTGRSWHLGGPPPSSGRTSTSLPVAIEAGDGRTDPGRLEVVLWD